MNETYHSPRREIHPILQDRMIGNSATQWKHRSSRDNEPLGSFSLRRYIINSRTRTLSIMINSHRHFPTSVREFRKRIRMKVRLTNSGLGQVVSVSCALVAPGPFLAEALVRRIVTEEGAGSSGAMVEYGTKSVWRMWMCHRHFSEVS